MPRRYVPKTYNNRRVLRLIIGMAITFALSVVILFLSLFFIFSGYVVDGQLIIPWLMDDVPAAAASAVDETEEEEDAETTSQENERPDSVLPAAALPDLDNPLISPHGDDDLNTFLPGPDDPDNDPPDDED